MITVFVVLMVAWFALLYFAESSARILLFRIADGGQDIMQELSPWDAVLLSISGLIGASIGITPTNDWSRLALGAELLGVALFLFWLFRGTEASLSAATRDPSATTSASPASSTAPAGAALDDASSRAESSPAEDQKEPTPR